MLSVLKDVFLTGVDIIYPAFCPVCRVRLNYSDHILCDQCWHALRELAATPSCPHCGKTAPNFEIYNGRCHQCHSTKSKLDYIVRVGSYDSPLKELLWHLKYSGQSCLDQFLGELVADIAIGRAEIRSADYLVPIPLHWLRRFRRGYNQSELLSDIIYKKLRSSGLYLQRSTDLVRVKNTPPQTTLTEARRRANLAGAFALRPDHPFSGKSVCLVDDVTTTGTTLETAARILRRSGAASVGAIVIMVP